MKNLLFILSLTFSSFSIGQTGVVILTETLGQVDPWPCTVYITMPDGTCTTHTITHEGVDFVQHESDLNVLINSIVSLGYVMIEIPGWGGGFVGPPGYTSPWTRRMYFAAPWTNVVSDLTLNNTTLQLSVSPNPSKTKISVSINDNIPSGWKFYAVDMKGVVMLISEDNEMDISSLSIGQYLIYGVKEGEYLEGVKFIKQ